MGYRQLRRIPFDGRHAQEPVEITTQSKSAAPTTTETGPTDPPMIIAVTLLRANSSNSIPLESAQREAKDSGCIEGCSLRLHRWPPLSRRAAVRLRPPSGTPGRCALHAPCDGIEHLLPDPEGSSLSDTRWEQRLEEIQVAAFRQAERTLGTRMRDTQREPLISETAGPTADLRRAGIASRTRATARALTFGFAASDKTDDRQPDRPQIRRKIPIPREVTLHCRVCGLLQYQPPWGKDGYTPGFEICDCCGIEFSYEDACSSGITRA